MADNIDEVVLNTLLADGLDFPTAYAASIVDSEPQPATYNYRRSIDLGLVVGLVLWIVWELV